MNAGQWARAYRAMAAELEAIDAEERAEHREWTSQVGSPLGPRRHCRAVDRRLAARAEGAARIGRKALLSPAALQEELSALEKKKPTEPKIEGTKERLERKLALVGGPR